MTNPEWDSHSIKAELHRRGMTLTRLAEIKGLNPNSFRAVWTRTHRKAEAAIAEFLDVPVARLFPDRYPIRSSSILHSKYDPVPASAKKAGAGRSAA